MYASRSSWISTGLRTPTPGTLPAAASRASRSASSVISLEP